MGACSSRDDLAWSRPRNPWPRVVRAVRAAAWQRWSSRGAERRADAAAPSRGDGGPFGLMQAHGMVGPGRGMH